MYTIEKLGSFFRCTTGLCISAQHGALFGYITTIFLFRVKFLLQKLLSQGTRQVSNCDAHSAGVGVRTIPRAYLSPPEIEFNAEVSFLVSRVLFHSFSLSLHCLGNFPEIGTYPSFVNTEVCILVGQKSQKFILDGLLDFGPVLPFVIFLLALFYKFPSIFTIIL